MQPCATPNRYEVVVCKPKLAPRVDNLGNIRKGYVSKAEAQDFAIDSARKYGVVSYVYDRVLASTVYRVDCTQTQATGKEFRIMLDKA